MHIFISLRSVTWLNFNLDSHILFYSKAKFITMSVKRVSMYSVLWWLTLDRLFDHTFKVRSGETQLYLLVILSVSVLLNSYQSSELEHNS